VTVAIASASGKATITGGTSSVLKGGTSATIKQSAGDKNVLELADANTVIDLGTEGDGRLVLTGGADDGAILQGAGSVVAGSTTITGGADGTWQAVGANTTIEITANNITGTGTGATLAGGANNSAVIEVAATATDEEDVTLTVTSATIDIGTNGTVTLTGNETESVSAIMVLKGGASAGSLLIVADGSQVNAVGANKTNLNIGSGAGGTTTPAEIKVNDASVGSGNVSALGNVVVLAAANSAETATLIHKLGGGSATGGSGDLWIVSSDDATATPITATAGFKLLAGS
jgi:hypothetical protein